MASQFSQASPGQFESLAGRKGQYLEARGDSAINCPPGYTRVLEENGSRVCAVIRNVTNQTGGVPADCFVQFEIDNAVDQSMLLRPGDVFIIDRDHPWCGPVTVQVAVAATPSVVDWYEVSVT